jgi:hypothetical protein
VRNIGSDIEMKTDSDDSVVKIKKEKRKKRGRPAKNPKKEIFEEDLIPVIPEKSLTTKTIVSK